MLMGLLREVALCCEAEQQRPARRDDAKTTDVGPDSYSSDYISRFRPAAEHTNQCHGDWQGRSDDIKHQDALHRDIPAIHAL